MLRLLLISFVLGFASSCVPSRYSCVDVSDTRREKVPLKYRFGKSNDDHPINLTQGSKRDYIASPPVASLSTQVISNAQALRSSQIVALIQSRSDSLEGPKLGEEVAELDKKALPRSAKKQAKQLGDPDDGDENYRKAKILGFISFFSSIFGFLFFPLSIVGLVTGLISLKKYRMTVNKHNRVFGLLGAIFSATWLLLIIGVIILIVLIFGGFGTGWTF